MQRALANENRRPARPALCACSVLATLGLACGVFACGPSVQSIYEGNVRFEHCYRLDLEVDTAPTHREACWKEWLGMYTYGQPRDRIEYARRRVHAFASGDVDRPTLDIDGARKTEARQFYLVVPPPTSIHAPPPPVATAWHGNTGSATVPTVPTAVASAAPGDKCASDCRVDFEACGRNCGADAGIGDPDCKVCDPEYKTCMERCFR